MAISNVAIVGAGIAGLTAALSFAQRGIAVHVIEQAEQLSAIGAGLQLSPNATRILDKLGVLTEIEQHWIEPNSINLASGIHARNIVELPIAQMARSRWGAPYGSLHRSTLQLALLHAVESQNLIKVHFGQAISNASAQSIIQITGEKPDLIVGADGVWSKVRANILGAQPATFSGNIALRFTIAKDKAPRFFATGSVTAFLGPNAHFIAYPLSEIDGFNCVFISHGIVEGETWDSSFSDLARKQLSKRVRDWHPEIRQRVADVENPRVWPLYEIKKSNWHNGTDTVLIGDAAHAMTPFAAQGAAMAIEDGYELARFASESSEIKTALTDFQMHRQPRIERARKRAAINRFAYHARGPFAHARDLLLAFRPEKAFLADFDWLYGYKAGS